MDTFVTHAINIQIMIHSVKSNHTAINFSAVRHRERLV